MLWIVVLSKYAVEIHTHTDLLFWLISPAKTNSLNYLLRYQFSMFLISLSLRWADVLKLATKADKPTDEWYNKTHPQIQCDKITNRGSFGIFRSFGLRRTDDKQDKVEEGMKEERCLHSKSSELSDNTDNPKSEGRLRSSSATLPRYPNPEVDSFVD